MILRMYDKKLLLCGLLLFSVFVSATSTDLVQDHVASRVTPQRLAEGGAVEEVSEDKTHLSREHVISNNTLITDKNLNTTQSKNLSGIQTSAGTSSSLVPVIEKTPEIDAGISKKNNGTQSVGKKEVALNGTNNSVSVKEHTTAMKNSTPLVTKPNPPTTKAPVPKKPLITEHDDFVSNDASTKSEPIPKLTNIDTILEKKSKRANYVIPIVAVILSVPLVAIIISVLYKRGTDWWQHRNYRRMDFLIEGMYNN